MKLETKRLILRRPRMSDWEDIYDGVRELDVAKRTENIPHPYSKEDAKNWIKKAIKKWNEDYVFLIELKSEKKVIGVLELMKINKNSRIAETGSWINKKYWRNGYITEAKIAVNDFAFNKLKLRKLNTTVLQDNLASNKTQKGVGYKLEGVKIKDRISTSTGKIHNLNLYGLLKEDWKKARPKLIKHLDEKIKKLENKK